MFLFYNALIAFHQCGEKMSRISEKNFNKIAESIVQLLYDAHPISMSTTQIADALARDNEFTGKVLHFLLEKGLVAKRDRENRIDWLLSKKAKENYDKLV